jgi:hypothetical protein
MNCNVQVAERMAKLELFRAPGGVKGIWVALSAKVRSNFSGFVITLIPLRTFLNKISSSLHQLLRIPSLL